MRQHALVLPILAILPFSLSAQEKPAPEKPTPQDYTTFAKLIHSTVVKQLPKEGFEDLSGWGQTIPAPDKLPLPALRTFIKVGNKLEVPHGTWRKLVGKIEDPDKNLKIVVKEFKPLKDTTYRVVADVDATFLCQVEMQQWQKGLLLIGGQIGADANVTAAVVCDVGTSFNFKKFPPEVTLEPKVVELGLDFVDFKVRNGPIIQGEFGDNLRKDLKEVFRGVMKASEPIVKDYANQAIVQSLKDGKGLISTDAILKALPKPKVEEKK
jgi:hypothetical protein